MKKPAIPMISTVRTLFLCGLIIALPVIGSAGPLIDFSTLSATRGSADRAGALGSVTAEAFKRRAGSSIWTSTVLVEGRQWADLDTCAEGTTGCRVASAASGDESEKFEPVRLALANGGTWSELWVSSLHGRTGPDPATLQLGSSLPITSSQAENPNNGAPSTGTPIFDQDGKQIVPPAVPTPGQAEGAPAGKGLRGGAPNIPEPSSLMLLGLGAGVALSRCRRLRPRQRA
jgi:hypothetical protein